MRAPLLAATALLLAACAGNGEPPAVEEERTEEVLPLPPAPEAPPPEAPPVEAPPEVKPPAETAREPEPAAGPTAPEQRLPPGEDPSPAPDLPSDAVDRAVLVFADYLATKPDPQGLRNQIAELALRKDPRVAEALKPLLRHKDDSVKIAVARVIGEQRDPKVARLLLAMADVKDVDKEKPELMAALLEGIGEAGGRRHYKFLISTAKKYLDIDPDIAAAAYRAAAHHVTRESVDDLLKELARADYVTIQDSAVKKAARHACREVLLDLLNGITGERIRDVRIWHEWWAVNKRTWTPPRSREEEEEAALNASDEYVDGGYGVAVRRPNRDWTFRRNEGYQPRVVIEALHEGRRAAWVELSVVGTRNYKSKTPEAWAAEMRAGFEKKFRAIDEAEWEGTSRVAGESAVEQVVRGTHREHDAIVMRNVYVCRSGVMVQCLTFRKEGTPPKLAEDIEAILGSLRFTR